MVTQFEIGDTLRLRKAHPCGGYEWVVVRLGADIGVTCTSCHRRLMMPRSLLERRMKGKPARNSGFSTNIQPDMQNKPAESEF